MVTCTQYHKAFQLFLALSAGFITLIACSSNQHKPSKQNTAIMAPKASTKSQKSKPLPVSSYRCQKASQGTKKSKKAAQSGKTDISDALKTARLFPESTIQTSSVPNEISAVPTKALCYQSCPILAAPHITQSTGTIPSWIHGTFFLNGPGLFEINGQSFKRWFDGFAMIHAFDIHKGQVTYNNSMVHSSYYTNACATGQLPASTQEKKSSVFSTFSNLVSERPPYDNTNVTIQVIDHTPIACTETDHCFAIDKHNGHTQHKFEFKDSLKGHVCTPHPLIDPASGNQYNVMVSYGKTSEYILYEIAANTRKRTAICTIAREAPSYMHSYALTKNYIILLEVPFQVRGMDLAFSAKPYLQNFTWQPENGTVCTLIDRTSKKVAHTITVPPLFMFHTINSYEADGQVIIDIVSYPDNRVINNMSLEYLRSNLISKPGNANRISLDLQKSSGTITPLTTQMLENPRINEQYRARQYRYFYAVSPDDTALVKVDTKTGTTGQWSENRCFVNEPTFVPKPDASAEDEGVLISVGIDTIKKQSFLLILDAQSLKELGRAHVPHLIPLGFHTAFMGH